jgi:hypothetical protein
MGNYLKVQGVQTVTNAIKSKGKAIEDGVKMNVEKYGAKIAAQAQSSASSILATWAKIDIHHNPTQSGLSYIIQAGDSGSGEMAAYFEFGTGKSYLQMQGSYTPEMKRIAQSYYKDGKGTIKAHPYLFPAYYKYRKEFIQSIKALVKKVV